MDPRLWQLEVAGDRRPLEGWGIEPRSLQLQRVNAAPDVLSFGVPSANTFAGPPFEYDAGVTLWRGDVRYFSGHMDDCIAGGSAAGEGWACRVLGPWQILEEIIYQQPYVRKSEDFSSNVGSMSSRVVFGKDAWGRTIPIDRQIYNIGAYALSQGGNLFALAELDPYHEAPMSEARDISCAAAIRRMMDLVPDSVAWFDYSSATPVLRIQRRGVLSSVAINVADGSIVRGFSSLRARNDLKARGVVFVFKTTEIDEATERSFTRETVQTAGFINGRRVIRATISLGGQGTNRPEAVPTGLAAAYFATVSALHYSGEVVLKERDCTGTVRPGTKLNLSGGAAVWATMDAVVQQTTESLGIGETEITLGPPSHLGAEDFADLMRYWRDRPPLSDFANVQDNGTEGVDDGGAIPGVDGFGDGAPDVDPGDRLPNNDGGRPSNDGQPSRPSGQPVSIPYCEGGIQKTATVYKAG